MKKFIIPVYICLLMILAAPVFAVDVPNQPSQGAQSGSPATGPGIQSGSPQQIDTSIPNPFKCQGGSGSGGGCNLVDFIKALINGILLPIGGVVAVVAFIWTGFLFVMAQGDPTKLKTAKTALWYTVIGTAILLGAWAIANVIGNTINGLRNYT